MNIENMAARIAELEEVCAEAYQVVGALALMADVIDTPEVEKVLDNLSEARMVHDDVLPFAPKPTPKPGACCAG